MPPGRWEDTAKGRKDVAASNGVFSINAADHNGMDNRARIMVRIENGKWVMVK